MTALTNNQSSFYLLDSMTIRVSNLQDTNYAYEIAHLIKLESLKPNSGLCIRSVHYLCDKIKAGKAVIAFFENELAGFCYIESWGQSQFIANSGLIVKMKFRGIGLARSMKKMIFDLSKEKFPTAKFFGLTTNLGVMKINSQLGYETVTYDELTDDQAYWKECAGCINFDILQASDYKNCLCTAFLFDPSKMDQHYFKHKFQERFELSRQEFRVFEQIILGSRTSQIAEKLFISNDTVSSHRKKIIYKTGAKTPLELYLLAAKYKLIDL
jgi:DNA-binding CsgD family transcriptional regulator